MSGYEVSRVVIDPDRTEKLDLLRRISTMQSRRKGLCARLKATLDGAPEGLRHTFAREMGAASEWLEDMGRQGQVQRGMDSAVNALRQESAYLSGQVSRGEDLLSTLVQALSAKADKMGKQMASDLADVAVACAANDDILKTWLGSDVTNQFAGEIREIERRLNARRLDEVPTLLQDLQRRVSRSVGEARQMADKDQKRQYVLTGLKEVCQEKGYRDIIVAEEGNDRKGPMVLTADTIAHGRIRFYVTLEEGIKLYSELPSEMCGKELGAISEGLDSLFGVKTEFQPRDGGERPQRKPGDARELPRQISRHGQGSV